MTNYVGPPVDGSGRVLEGPLNGYVVAEPGRRVLARFLDIVVGVVGQIVLFAMLFGGLYGALATGSGGFGFLVVAAALIPFVYLAYAIYTYVRRASTVGQRILGLSMVNPHTGAKASGRAFGKTLLEELTALFTLGLGYLASWFTMQGPLHRNWLDRLTDVVVVDTRRGRGLKDAAPAAAMIAAEPQAPVPVQFERQPAVPEPGRARFAQEATTLQPVSADPVVTRTPWGPPVAERQPTIVEAPVEDMTVIDPAGPGIRLDNGMTYDLDTAVVIGRDPVAPGAVSDAQLISVPDRTMSVSKTHLAIGKTGSSVWVRDLNSTNGVHIRNAAGEKRAVAAGKAEPVDVGEFVLFGDRSLEVTG